MIIALTAHGFAIALSGLLIMADPAGKAPRPIISGPPKTWQILDTEPPKIAESQITRKQLAQLNARALKSGIRTLSLPCNEEFRQAFIKDARAFLAENATTGSFGTAIGRMSSLQFDKPHDAQEAIENALNARHVSHGELSTDGLSGIPLGLLLNPQYQPVTYPLMPGVPIGRAASGEAAGRYTPPCMAGPARRQPD
jgi:hypothetical protein